MQKFILVLLGVVVHSLLVNAFISPMRAHVRRTQQLNMVDFGKTNYKGFEDWCSGYAEDQKEKWPTYFVLPEGVYEVQLQKPLGIVFEEVEADGRKGCFVSELVPDGNAEKAGVGVGDLLLATTGVKVRGAKFDRPLIQADNLDYETIIGAIQSNESGRGMNGPILQFLRKDAPYPEEYINGEMRNIASPLEDNGGKP